MREVIPNQLALYGSFGKDAPVGVRFLQEFGKFYEPLPVTLGKYGVAKQCYHNCANLMDSDMHYTEGYGILSDLLLPLPHAWLTIDTPQEWDAPTEGFAVDVTWRPKPGVESLYFGVKFAREFVEEVSMITGFYGIFESLYMLRMSPDECYEYLKTGII